MPIQPVDIAHPRSDLWARRICDRTLLCGGDIFLPKFLHANGPQTGPGYLTVTITNIGTFPLRIPYSFFALKLPLSRRGTVWLVLPVDYYGSAEIPKWRYPVEISPRSQELLMLCDWPTLEGQTKKIWNQLSRFEKARFRFLSWVVCTDDGRVFKAKVSKTVREAMRSWTV
jgi:hypothetical protein